MKLKTWLAIKAACALIVGLCMLTIPGIFLSVLGVADGLGAAIYGRIYGAACIGILLLTWFGRNVDDSVARKAIILDLCVYDAIAFITTLVVQLSGATNALGWIVVAFYLLFTLAFGYYLLPRRNVPLNRLR